MSKITQSQSLGAEGTILFRLTPIENNTDRLYLIDVGEESKRNRITLVTTKKTEGRNLVLEIYNDDGEFLNAEKDFPGFQLGAAFDVELVWSTQENKIAVFVNEELFIQLEEEKVKFGSLSKEIHFGEDIFGNNKTEVDSSVK